MGTLGVPTVKARINRFLRRFGYQVVAISRTTELLNRTRAERPEFTFVQIGANDGVRFDGLYAFVTGTGCRGVVVEPVPDYFERLSKNYEHFPMVKPVRAALHPTATTATLYRIDPDREAEVPGWASGIASFLPDHHEKLGIPKELMIEEQVPCITLMHLLRSEGLTDLDLLQVDTEGFDAEIVAMIDFDVVRPRIVKYEHVSLSEADRTRTERALTAQGYRLFREGGDTVAHRG